MANKRYDVCAPRPKKDGGTFWARCGTAWEGDKGINIVFDTLPLPDAEGRCSVSLFEPRENNRQQSRQQSGGWNDLDDSVPFS